MKKSTTVATACGRCLAVHPSHFEPDVCRSCGADFAGPGSVFAVMRVDAAAEGERFGLEQRIDFFGPWTNHTREVALDRLRNGARGKDDARHHHEREQVAASAPKYAGVVDLAEYRRSRGARQAFR